MKSHTHTHTFLLFPVADVKVCRDRNILQKKQKQTWFVLLEIHWSSVFITEVKALSADRGAHTHTHTVKQKNTVIMQHYQHKAQLPLHTSLTSVTKNQFAYGNYSNVSKKKKKNPSKILVRTGPNKVRNSRNTNVFFSFQRVFVTMHVNVVYLINNFKGGGGSSICLRN